MESSQAHGVTSASTVSRAIPVVFRFALLSFFIVATANNTFRDNSYSTVRGNIYKQSATDSHSMTVPVGQLTKSHIQDNLECPEPLVPLYDKVVSDTSSGKQNIPRAIHMAWIRGFSTPQSRCISPDMMEIVDKWKEAFPSYSLHFHDDEAVDTLLGQEWPEFPQLPKLMKSCVKYGNAMRIDIWRVLILYRYGGFYSDFEVAPGLELNESTVDENDSFFSLSDSWNRPSQWLHGMEPNHPIAFFTALEIFTRLLKLEDVSEVKLVFLTGPDAFKTGYSKVVLDKNLFEPGVHQAKYNKIVRKLPLAKYAGGFDRELVPFPRNSSSPRNVTKKERALAEMKAVHWKKAVRERVGIPKSSCWDQLYMAENNATSLA
uniref:Uncharacterized protein n=1 Tax=Odontella aurita TaxID=265563 RepID=A0A7S4N1V1_9STRA|mmetsp:Transcript_43517/g.132426  ORF Transcript_43517/g.132426 Transcript_43517/m.132426 type:complete len:375 (+) Transcript_43517:163-1287(+)